MPARPIVEVGAEAQADLIATLADAFQDDPAVSWIFPDATARRERLPRVFALIVPGDLGAGAAFASPGGQAATLWRRPGEPHTGMLAMVRLLIPLIGTFGSALGRAMRISTAIERSHPPGERYWYLHYAGVRAAHQGQGWGRAAIRAGLSRADAEGLPALLETATERNVGLYRSLGFDVTSEWDVPGGGPHFWSMVRPAKSG